MGPMRGSRGPSASDTRKRNTMSGPADGAPSARSDAPRRSQKRAKLHSARHIPAQPADAALKDGELDLQAFVAAHEFEIRSHEQSMATSQAVSSTRAFQQVPRGLRRRTASHNPKRVPRRQRAKARKEMEEDGTPLVESRRRKPKTTRARIRAETAKRLGILAARKRKRLLEKEKSARAQGKSLATEAERLARRQLKPKIRRNQLNDPPRPPARFRKRQINKTWLPTHKWHAKRAHMTDPKNPLWRFAIPLTPTEKVYRPTHRAQGERGTMVWDMSYMSTIGVYGSHNGIEKTLKNIGVIQESCWNDKGTRWRMGSRAWSGYLSRQQDGGLKRSMCPATIIWNPEPTASQNAPTTSRGKRQLFIRVHPAAFLEVFAELVRLSKMKGSGVFVEDLRFEIGSIELTGPASTETLLSTLTPYATEEKPKNRHASLFGSLKGLSNPASLPANSVLGFPVQDPRLRHPPRKMEPSCDAEAENKLLEVLAQWPAEEQLEPYGLFDRTSRFQAKCLPTQKTINRRRSAISPGSFLKPAQIDPPIPIILISSRSPTSTQAQGTWVLLMPWRCVLPLWFSIVHCPLISGMNPRFGGLNETMQVAFERGLPWFPTDHVGTDSGAKWELEERQKRQRAYDRRPKSKRTQWATLDLGAGRKGEIGDGLACDYELLFDLPAPPRTTITTNEPELVQADGCDDDDAMDVVDQQASTPDTRPHPPSLMLLNSISGADFLRASSSVDSPPTLAPHAVVNVRITLLSRGAATTCARIYRLPTPPTPTPTPSNAQVPATIPPPRGNDSRLPHDLRAQWLSQVPPARSSSSTRSRGTGKPTDMESRRRLLAQELTAPPAAYPPPPPNQVDVGGHPLVPDATDLIGFVTSGSYCLRDGKAAAIGSVAVDKVIPGVKANSKEGRLCIVRNAGENIGWIARWEAL
ncbi:Ribonuclease P/MRP, subunit POP1 [Metarhizium album ARSEF 1941]|uniref:Ribonuclease P/MRP, subunit POP1 n=1 Tax=Metarhizium album (strain ARSEF 1941) TaxID=1081103 RepID=A0A0B2X127_METAS|nr:Ribonuclease P/MRP, subunit POP1 [Metarhizium album ARSEF 1941]KHN98750.1 Ribonuclease P/MRP, subunit POP1 [Metarhizium album ARSEF 1941]